MVYYAMELFVMNLSELQQFVTEQGWSVMGTVDFTDVSKNLTKHQVCYQRWSSNGYKATMDYLDRMESDRFHPENKLSDIQSVLVLGANYSDERIAVGDELKDGMVARYARGKDYHKVLKKKLIELADWLKKSKGEGQKSKVETYVSVDSGPTVDRVLAESAGLGFFGKNSCLIDPSKGSFFFLASLYTNLKLPLTEQRRMPSCGDCTRCMDSCPTGAIVSPGVVDARRCISYLTIENKGVIPLEFRRKIGNRLFGCDTCQEVCPFNQGRAHRQSIQIEAISGQRSAISLVELLNINTDEEFTQKFAGTPLMRAKREGLLRNACVVAGNSGDLSLIPTLKNLIKESDSDIIFSHAQWAIDELSKSI